ncbi:MAG TPA: hypothetical protein VFY97_11445 [Rhodanobacteraceae bacterium]|nr:hypothetical protein [Rhodanobacteraceae bacterium]
MKQLSLCLAVLLLAGVPLSAAALDYGANSPLLAVDTSAPQLPGVQARPATRGDAPDLMANDDAGDAVPVPPRMAPSAASSRQAPAAYALPATAHNQPSHPPATHPAQAPTTAPWQSLLPGSIQ